MSINSLNNHVSGRIRRRRGQPAAATPAAPPPPSAPRSAKTVSGVASEFPGPLPGWPMISARPREAGGEDGAGVEDLDADELVATPVKRD